VFLNAFSKSDESVIIAFDQGFGIKIISATVAYARQYYLGLSRFYHLLLMAFMAFLSTPFSFSLTLLSLPLQLVERAIR
jgi:hypothetical protein